MTIQLPGAAAPQDPVQARPPAGGNPYAALLDAEPAPPAAAAAAPAVPQDPPQDVYGQLLDRDQQAADQLLMASLRAARMQDPELAGEAQRLSAQTGIPDDIVQRNLDEVRRRAAELRLEQQRRAVWSPVLQQQLSDPKFAALAHDDVDNLGLVDRMFAGWETGQLLFERGMVGERVRSGRASQQDYDRLVAINRRMEALPASQGFLANAAEIGGQVSVGIPRALREGAQAGIGAGVAALVAGQIGPQALVPEEVVTGPAAALGGFAAAFTARMGADAYTTEAGNAYLEFLDSGVDERAASAAAVGVGLVNSALELVGAGAVTAPVRRALLASVRSQVAEALVRPTLRTGAAQAAIDYATGVGGEVATEVLQEVSTVVGELAAGGDPVDVDARLAEIATKTFQGMALLGAPGPAFAFRRQAQRVRQAEAAQEFFAELGKASTDSKVRERNPEAWAAWLEARAAGSAADTVYVDARTFSETLRQSGVTREQLAEIVPDVAATLEQAATLGEDVAVPIGTWQAKLAPLPLGAALQPHLRLDPDALTFAEAQTLRQNARELTDLAKAATEREEAVREQWTSSARAVEEQMRQQLIATGRMGDQEARTNALLYREFVVTQAQRAGLTPGEWQARFAVTVEGVAADGRRSGGRLSQGERQAPDTPEFREWFGDSKVVDEKGQPLVVYHGTKSPTEDMAFDFSKIGTNGRAEGAGFYFTTDEKVAQGYATGTLLQTWLSIRKPMPLSQKGFTVAQLRKIVQRAAELEAEAEGADIRDGFLSNYGDTYTSLSGAIAEAAKLIAADQLAVDQMGGMVGSGLSPSFVNKAVTEVTGFDGVVSNGFGNEGRGGGTIYVAFQPEQIKSVNNRGTFDPTDPNILRSGPRGDFDPARLHIRLFEHADPRRSSDSSTFLHELGHAWLTILGQLATQTERAVSAQIRADFQTFLDWAGIGSADAWLAMSLEQQRKAHEAFAASFELYLFEGKAPSVELKGVFARFRQWLTRVYRAIRDELNAAHRTEFGEDLPGLTPEIRGVFDRMLASEEQIAHAVAVRDAAPLFLSQEESGLSDADWAAYQQEQDEQRDEATRRLTEQSLSQMRWLSGARGKVLREMQERTERTRSALREVVAEEVRLWPVFRAEQFLVTGLVVEQDGASTQALPTGPGLNENVVRRLNGLAEKLTTEQKAQRQREVREERARRLAAMNRGRAKSMVTRIRELGGITRESWDKSYPGERKGEWRIRGVVRRSGGMDWEKMASTLRSEGYGPQNEDGAEHQGYEWFVDAMADAVSGVPTYRAEDYAKLEAEPDMRAPESPEERARRLAAEGMAARRESGRRLGASAVRRMQERGLLRADGAHPDEVAPLFGFRTGEELVRDLALGPTMDEAVERLLDERMLAEHSELVDPAAREEAVEQALHNEARARFVAVELQSLTRAEQPRRIMLAAAREAAARIVEGTKVRELRTRPHSIAEARAAREARDALRRNDGAAAVAAKRRQMLQGALVRQVGDARQEVARSLRQWRRLWDSDEKLARTRDIDLVIVARAMLQAHGVGDAPAAAMPLAQYQSLQRREPELAAQYDEAIQRASAGAVDYRDLSLEEFRALRDTIEALWWRSGRNRRVELDGRTMELDSGAAMLAERLEARGIPAVLPGENAAPTLRDSIVRGLLTARAVMRRVQHATDSLDGLGGVGPWTRLVWRPVRDAMARYRKGRNEFVEQFVELLRKADLREGAIEAPELGYTFAGKAELLGALLHTGNGSNLYKLLVGRGWGSVREDGSLDARRWWAFRDRMIQQGILTRADFEFAQGVWQLNERMKPLAQEAHRSLYGYYFREIKAEAQETPWGTFEGGYVPAAADAFLERSARLQQDLADLAADFRAQMPMTPRGFTKNRDGSARALSLDVRKMAAHIDQVMRFVHVQPVLRDVQRLLEHRDVAGKLARIDPTAYERMFLPWLVGVARGGGERGIVPWLDSFWRTLRKRTGLSVMFANISNALQQLTGYFPAATKVPPRHLAAAFRRYRSDHRGLTAEVVARSLVMQDRLQSQMFDLADEMQDLLANPGRYRRLERWSGKNAYFLQRAFQNQVDVVTWVAAFDHHMAEVGADVGDADAVRAAVAHADDVVTATQGSTNIEDRAAFERGTPFQQVLTQFTGYFNALANLNGTEFAKVLREFGWRGGSKRLGVLYLLGFAAPTILADGIARLMRGDWGDDDDTVGDVLAEWLLGSQVRGAAALVPFGSYAASLANAWNDKPWDDRLATSPALAAVEASTIGVTRTIRRWIEGDDVTGKNVRDVLTLLSLLSGVPVAALGRPIGYATDVASGDVEPTGPVDMMRGLVTGAAGAGRR